MTRERPGKGGGEKGAQKGWGKNGVHGVQYIQRHVYTSRGGQQAYSQSVSWTQASTQGVLAPRILWGSGEGSCGGVGKDPISLNLNFRDKKRTVKVGNFDHLATFKIILKIFPNSFLKIFFT
jgi:hypothetical protein